MHATRDFDIGFKLRLKKKKPIYSGFYDIFYLYFEHYSVTFAYTRLLTYILNNPGESRGFWVNFRSNVTEARIHTSWTLNSEFICFKDRKVLVPQSANYSVKSFNECFGRKHLFM